MRLSIRGEVVEHINAIELIEYVGGKLAVPRHKEVQEHIANCDECARRWQEMVCTWDTLAKWDIDTTSHSIIGRIQAMAGKGGRFEGHTYTTHLPLRRFFAGMFRVAASIIIGISFGHLMGKWNISNENLRTEVSIEVPKYVRALALECSTGFVQSMLEENTSEEEEDQL